MQQRGLLHWPAPSPGCMPRPFLPSQPPAPPCSAQPAPFNPSPPPHPTPPVLYAWSSGLPATTGGPPPCILSARTVATMTMQSGDRPLRARGQAQVGASLCAKGEMQKRARGLWRASGAAFNEVSHTNSHLYRHLMLQNFSAPMSAPKPACAWGAPGGHQRRSAGCRRHPWPTTSGAQCAPHLAAAPPCSSMQVC